MNTSPALSDVRSAEQHDAVAVGVGVRLVIQHDRFAVEVHVLRRHEVLVDRHAAKPFGAAQLPGRERRQRRGHAAQDALVRDDVERLQRIGSRGAGGPRESGRGSTGADEKATLPPT